MERRTWVMDKNHLVSILTLFQLATDLYFDVYDVTSSEIIFSNSEYQNKLRKNILKKSINNSSSPIMISLSNHNNTLVFKVPTFKSFLFAITYPFSKKSPTSLQQSKLKATAQLLYTLITNQSAPHFQKLTQIDYSINDNLSFIQRQNYQLQHNDYTLETKMLTAIQEANNVMFNKYCTEFLNSGRLGKMSNLDNRNRRNTCIAALTLFTRAAIKGGVPSERALEVSDQISQELDKVNTIDINLFVRTIGPIFITEVQHHQKKFPPLINQINNYIKNNLYSSLSTINIAAIFNYTPEYLSRLYKSFTGKSISQFIMISKIEEAKKLLKFSNNSIHEIANLLNFSNQSNFTHAFNHYVGITPSKYRKE